MAEYGIVKYNLIPKVIIVTKGTTEVIAANEDLYFLGSYQTNGTEFPNGEIRAKNSGLTLNSVNANTEFFKHQIFKNIISIQNKSITVGNKLYVEFIIAAPIL